MPAGNKEHFNDRTMETIMGRLLQVGVLLASFVMLVGGVMYLLAHYAAKPDYRVFKSEPPALPVLNSASTADIVEKSSDELKPSNGGTTVRVGSNSNVSATTRATTLGSR